MEHHKNLLLEKKNGILTVTINRPEKLNALTWEGFMEIIDLFESLPGQDDVRVIILTGAGKAFCVGADMSVLEFVGKGTLDEIRASLDKIIKIALIFQTLEKPIIAAINGYALGAGLNMTLACDMRIAADSAILGEEFINQAIFPDLGGAYLLPQIVGPGKARELQYTGARISAQEAEKIGLVDRVVAADKLMDEVHKLAELLVSKSPLAMAISKRTFHLATQGALEHTLKFESSIQSICLSSKDHEEAVKAFLEKRKPVFTGK